MTGIKIRVQVVIEGGSEQEVRLDSHNCMLYVSCLHGQTEAHSFDTRVQIGMPM